MACASRTGNRSSDLCRGLPSPDLREQNSVLAVLGMDLAAGARIKVARRWIRAQPKLVEHSGARRWRRNLSGDYRTLCHATSADPPDGEASGLGRLPNPHGKYQVHSGRTCLVVDPRRIRRGTRVAWVRDESRRGLGQQNTPRVVLQPSGRVSCFWTRSFLPGSHRHHRRRIRRRCCWE